MEKPSILFVLMMRASPRRFRDRYRNEISNAFLAAVREKRERDGRWAALLYRHRALFDLLRSGLGERRRERRSRATAPRGRIGPSGIRGNASSGSGEGRGSGPIFGELGSDLRYSARRLGRSPGFTAAAIVVLAFGIGANSTIFSALKTAVLADPPYPHPHRLVLPAVLNAARGHTPMEITSWSYPKYRILKELPNRLIDPLAAYAVGRPTLTGAGDAVRIDAELVSPDYFKLLGVSPLLGRTFASDEDDPSSPPMVAILGHGLWQTRFGGSSDVLGGQVTVDGHTLTVIGVMPRDFTGITGLGELWLPFAASGALMGDWRIIGPEIHWFYALGRVSTDVRMEDASAQMSVVAETIRNTFLDREGNPYDYSGILEPLKDAAVNETARASILVLSAAAGLVLVIACANLAGLLLARAGPRRRETAVRLAMGAGRARIVRQHLTESLLLAVSGGVGGLALARWGIDALALMAPQALISGSGSLRFLDTSDLALDGSVVLFTLVLACVTSVVFGLAPALKLSRSGLLEDLKEGLGATAAVGGPRSRVDPRSVLVGAQIALAMVLLVSAGLMIGSLSRLHRVETGVDTHNLLTFSYTLPAPSASSTLLPDLEVAGTEEDPIHFHSAFLERIRSIPGVRAATIGCPPLGGVCAETGVREIGGEAPLPRTERPLVNIDVVEDSYFQTLGARVLRGRSFTPTDRAGGIPVMIVNESAAHLLFPGRDALGQRLGVGGFGPTGEDGLAEIVGIVDDILYESPDRGVQPMVYSSLRQVPNRYADVLVRTEGDPFSVVPVIRSELRQLDPNLAIFRVTTVGRLGTQATGTTRMIMELLSLFAAVAMVLAAVGIYGVVAYAVALRNREIGIRMAVGARAREVTALVLRRGALTAGVGIGVGLMGAWGVTRLLSSLLYGVTATDPMTYVLSAAVLLGAALLASYLPARRATRVDPMQVLRVE